MSFVIYDLVFLAVFLTVLIIFLYLKRNKLKRQGLLYLYRTNVGVKIIDKTAKKYSKLLRSLQYVVIACGYILMGIIVWVLAKFSYSYLSSPTLARNLKAPILLPLVPYVDKFFSTGFLPPFYFTYWILIIAVIAIPHEFAHGIFARFNKIKIHSTGFGFLGPFLAAFVEPDEKQMSKAKKIPQMSILAAGTFANLITAVLFLFILWAFFALAFTPAGVYFNTYSVSLINTSDIQTIDGLPFNSFTLDSTNITLLKINTEKNSYYIHPSSLENYLKEGKKSMLVYEDSPALRVKLSGAITKIDNSSILSFDDLKNAIQSHKPGDIVSIKTISEEGKITNYSVKLAEKDGKAFLGIGVIPLTRKGLTGMVYALAVKIKNPSIYYVSLVGNLGLFVFDLLWWLVLVCFSVALFNMIPMGIFDGGRFFYLTMWGITGSKKVAEKSFKFLTWAILLLITLLMLKWILIFF